MTSNKAYPQCMHQPAHYLGIILVARVDGGTGLELQVTALLAVTVSCEVDHVYKLVHLCCHVLLLIHQRGTLMCFTLVVQHAYSDFVTILVACCYCTQVQEHETFCEMQGIATPAA